MSELSDRVLWRQAGEGHAGAFGILFERHAGRIYNYCFRRTADWALAEELTSTTFLLAWRSRSRAPLRAESALPLLYGIATNVVRNQRRSLKRRREALLRLPLERSEEPDFAEEIAARIDDEAGMQELLRLFAQLPRPFPAGARPAPAAGTRNGERTRSGGRCRPASHRGDRAMSFRLTPPPERDFPAGRLQQRKEQLVSEIYATAEPAPRYPRRILVSVVAIAVAGIFAAAAYAGYALTRPVTPVVTIGCYETDSLDANTAVLSAGKSSPIAACTDAYASAFPGSQKPSSFAACLLPSGSVGVFPGDTTGDTCESLGLAKAP